MPPDPILRYFRHDHLPPALAKVSKIFTRAAAEVAVLCPPSAERTVAFRKLLEGKDAAVRSIVPDREDFAEYWDAIMNEVSAP